MFDPKMFGNQIRKYRKELGLTISEFAISLDIGYSYLGEIEKGRQIPSLPLAIKVLNKLNINFSDCLNQEILIKDRDIKIDFVISILNKFDQKDIEYLLKNADLLSGEDNINV